MADHFRWRIVQRALMHKKAKALLIVLAVTMGSSVVAALLNLQTDLRQRMNRELRDYGPNVLLLPASKNQDQYLNEALWGALEHSSAGSRILNRTAQSFLPVQLNGAPTVLTGSDLSALKKLYPGWKWDLPSDPGTDDVILGSRLAVKLNVKPGSKVTIKLPEHSVSRRVAGILEGGESEDDRLFMDLKEFQKLTDTGGQFQVIALSVLGDIQTVESIFRAFVQNHPEVSFQVIRKIAAAETVVLDKISRLMGLVIALIFVILFFCIHTTVSAILLSRQSEIALLRVLGARRKQITAGLTLELLILGLGGGLLGFLVGMIMAQVLGRLIFQAYIFPRVGIFLITIVSSLAMMVISSLVPISRAVNRQAATVLKES